MQDTLKSQEAAPSDEPSAAGSPPAGPPPGRVTAVDWFKGFAIASMCMLHYATQVLGAFNADIHSRDISVIPMLDGFLQLHNGAFFLLSAFGNWFSIRRGMDRAEAKSPGSPDYGPVVKTILVRGALIMGLGMFATFALDHDLFDNLIRVGGGGRGIEPGQWGQAIKDSFFGSARNGLLSPAVTPYIGFTVMVGGLIAFKVEKHHGPAASRQKTKTMAQAWISIFIVGFFFRKLMDHATCNDWSPCVGGNSCVSWNQTELDAAHIKMPIDADGNHMCFTTHAPNLDFSDVPDWAGPNPVGPNNISCPHSVSTDDLVCPHGGIIDGEWVDEGPAQSFVRGVQARCLRGYPHSVSDVSFAHMTDLDRGWQCCSTAALQRGSTTAEELSNPRLECCQMTPWYGPPHGSGGSMGDGAIYYRTNWFQKCIQMLLWPLAGSYGFFCYGAESIAGYLIAMHVVQNGWTRELFQAMFGVAFVCMAVAGPADWWLFFQDGNESIQQASPINRMYIFATELVAFAVICGVIEGRRHTGFFGCCSVTACCAETGCCGLTKNPKYRGMGGAERFKKTLLYRFYKRFGMVSFTIYHTESNVRNLTSFLLGELGGRAPPFCVGNFLQDTECYAAKTECVSPQTPELCAKCEAGEQIREGYGPGTISTVPVGLLYVGCVIAFWGIGLWQWEKFGFVGSFEWGMQKVLSATRKAKSNVLSASTHDEKPFVAGSKGPAGEAEGGGGEEWRQDIPFGEMCPCSFCGRCGSGGGGEQSEAEMSGGGLHSEQTPP